MLLDKLVRLGTISALVGSIWLYHDASRERRHARAERQEHREGRAERDVRARIGFDGERRRPPRRAFSRGSSFERHGRATPWDDDAPGCRHRGG